MIWFALLIPIIAALIVKKYFQHAVAWWEPTIPIAAVSVCILFMKFGTETALVSDTEYWGNLITEMRYYEYYETYVRKTCPEEYECGKNDDGTTKYCTRYVDCSYCDKNNAYWIAIDDAGNEFNISEEYYKKITANWRVIPEKVELKRQIKYRRTCGQDGDMYKITWNKDWKTSEASVTEHHYTNKVQASHSAFKLSYVSKNEAQKLGLFDYPQIYDYYKQQAILGLDSLNINVNKQEIKQLFQFFNGYKGPLNKVKLFVLLFKDKPLEISYKQEAYWDRGNKNELVICIGTSKTGTIDWVRGFSWADNKRVLIEARENIASLKKLDFHRIYDILDKDVNTYFHYKDFDDFNYLEVDLPESCYWITYILSIILTILINIWIVKNEFESDKTNC